LISDLSELSIKNLISDANILFHVVANKLKLKVSVVPSFGQFPLRILATLDYIVARLHVSSSVIFCTFLSLKFSALYNLSFVSLLTDILYIISSWNREKLVLNYLSDT